MLLGPMTKGKEADLSPMLKQFSRWVAAEPSHTGETLLDTWIKRDVLRMEFFSQMREYPILLCPVASIPAFRHGERSWQHRRARPCNISTRGVIPSGSTYWELRRRQFPLGDSNEGLPIGVQIVARPWEEELVLAVAAELEAQCGAWRGPDI